MKKTFTFFAISALFLMLLFPVSVKADDLYVRNFGYQDNQWTQDSKVGQTSCAGNISPADKIITGSDFYFSGRHDDAFKRSDNEWTGVNGANNNHAGVKACTRESKTVSLSVGTYTFKLLSKSTENATLTLPIITVGGTEYSVNDVLNSSGESQTFSNNQFAYTSGNEFTLCYTVTISGSAYNGNVSIEFKDGWKEKYLFKTLTITQNAATYDVTATATNGSVSGTGSYAEGAEVTLTASPNEDYSFIGWSSSDINIADASANPLVFSMPAKAVSVTATFAECTKHAVTLTAGANGSVSGGGEQCDGSVTVTATPYPGYRFVNWTEGGSQVSTDAVYTFTLLEDISLTANFEVDPCTNTKTIQCEDYVSYNTKPSGSNDNKPEKLKSKDYTGYGNPIGGYYADFDGSTGEMWIPVTLPAGTFTFTVRYVKGGNNMWFNLYDVSNNSKIANSKQLSQKGDSWDSDVSNSYTLTSGDYVIGIYGNDNYTGLDQITITATSNVFCPNTITMQKSGDDEAAAPSAQVNSSNVTTAFEGATVTVTAGAPSANHNFSGWTVSPQNAVTFADQKNATTTFVMPAEDVTITANYEASVSSALTFSAGEGGSITSATAGGNAISSGNEVISGTSVTLTAGANSNYVFINWTDNNSDEVVSTNAAFTFSMPATATSYTANFAQIDNVIITGSTATVTPEYGDATLTVTSVSDFDAFNHNVLKFAYSDMAGKYKGQKVAIDEGYNFASSAGATGFGFYYKTEKADDNVAFCFEVSSGHQVKWELQATNNVWKYYYFAHAEAAGWNQEGIIIYMNGDDDGAGTHTTYKDGGAFYMSEIAATSIISKDDIDSYTYTRENASNSYGTLCLPMDGSVSGATLYSVAGKQEEGGKLYIVLEEQGATLEAGEPYIFETNGETLTATMSGPHSDVKADANGLVGTYQRITAPAYSESDNLNYILALDDSNNTVFKKVGANVTVGAYRAYINIQNADDYSPASAAPGRKYIRFGIEGTEEEQAVEMIYDDASLRTRKIMQNGHLYILRDGHLFTAQGTQIK